MLQELQTLNKIAMLKEEDEVIRRIIRGNSRANVLKYLQEKYPNEKINRNDVDDFLLLYRDILYHEKTNIEKHYVRRLIKSQEGLTNQLIDLATQATSMANRYDSDGDNSNAVAAIRTAADIFMKFGKVQGLTKEQPDININMQLDKIVNEVSNKDSNFKSSLKSILGKKDEQEKEIEQKIIEAEVVNNDRK